MMADTKSNAISELWFEAQKELANKELPAICKKHNITLDNKDNKNRHNLVKDTFMRVCVINGCGGDYGDSESESDSEYSKYNDLKSYAQKLKFAKHTETHKCNQHTLIHLLTFGYIRINVPQNNIFYIPYDIKCICAAYYCVEDRWDKNIITDYTITEYDKCLQKRPNTAENFAFLSNVVFNGIHQWQFTTFNTRDFMIRIGICKNDQNVISKLKTSYDRENMSYEDICDVKIHTPFHMHNEEYLIVDMYLDFDRLKLFYTLNGRPIYPYYIIKPGEYRVCLSISSPKHKIKLHSYRYYFNFSSY
eukprot:455911_1